MRISSSSALALAAVMGLSSMMANMSANAADFSINPTRITLDSKRAVDTLTLMSNEDREISFEVSLIKWEQSPGGQWIETPSRDLVVYPALIKMDPRGKGIVRVGSKIKEAVEVEGAYRLVLQELPGGPGPEGTAVRLLTRVSLPVFIQPTTPKLDLSLAAERVGGGAKLTVLNRGNVRLDPQGTKVEFLDASGNSLSQAQDATPGPAYVLAGSSSSWTQEFKGVSCSAAQSVKITLEEKGTSLTAPLTGSCK